MVRWHVAAVLAVSLGLFAPLSAYAQSDAAGRVAIRIEADAETGAEADAGPIWVRPDSARRRVAQVIDSLRGEGYYFALEKRSTDERSRDEAITHVVRRGPLVRLGELVLSGVPDETVRLLRSEQTLQEGDPFDLRRMEADVGRMLARLEREGRPLAEAWIESIDRMGESVALVSVTVRLQAGPRVWLKRIESVGGERTRSGLIAQLAQVRPGAELDSFEPERIRRRLEESGLFASVGTPFLLIDADTTAIIRVPVQESDPGSFDLVLGYLPPAGTGGRGSVVGSGHLALRNVLGRGRELSLRLHRLPGEVSRIDVAATDPYVADLPVGVEFAFHGLEQDSTYGKRSIRGEASYHLAAGLDLVGGLSREVVSPGHGGLRLGEEGRQIVPHSQALFVGLGVQITLLDRHVNPTSGVFLVMNLESGRKRRTERRIAESDTLQRASTTEQQRLNVSGRYYMPTLDGQVLVAGGDVGVLLSGEFDRSDLFRFGGATSLRGYDEDRFLGAVVGRTLLEYRFLIDRISYAFAFFDLGYVDRPRTPDATSSRGWHPGYGIGIQFETGVGLVNVSAALNPDSGPTGARIHAGLSFGL
ncbi:MAG: BamA/TamA family outer membrane protein [Rhodothermales bacterium]